MEKSDQSPSQGPGTNSQILKNDKRTITGWAFFDWANSAYALVITVAIFPGYFLTLTNDTVNVFGLKMGAVY